MHGRIKITVISLAVALVTLIGSTATLSYFTDSDSVVASFAIGQAKTQLLIYSDADKLAARDFDAGLPSVYEQFASENPLVSGVARKLMPMAKNTGNIPVYQRFRVLIPKGLLDSGKFIYAVGCAARNDASRPATCEGIDYEYGANLNKSDTVTLGGIEYYQLILNHIGILAVGEWTSNPPLDYVQLSTSADSDWITSAIAAGWIVDGKFNIHVYSEAVQAEGFANASAAFSNFVPTYAE